MPADQLPNSRINGLPLNAILKPGYLSVVYNSDKDLTEAFDIGQLLTSTSGDFEWLPDPKTYNTDEVVTYKGVWWQAVQDVPVDVVPGTDAGVYWTELNKGESGFVFWQAGVYPQDDVIVLSDRSIAHDKSDVRCYILMNTTRPFVSSDFDTELAAGDWKQLFESAISPVTQYRGGYDASTNLYPTTGGSAADGSVVAGDEWYITDSNTSGLDGDVWPVKTLMRALTDTPGQDSNKWRLI